MIMTYVTIIENHSCAYFFHNAFLKPKTYKQLTPLVLPAHCDKLTKYM